MRLENILRPVMGLCLLFSTAVHAQQTPSVLVCEHLYLQVLHIADAAGRGVPLATAIRTTEAFVDYAQGRGHDSLFVALTLLELVPLIYRDVGKFTPEVQARAIRYGCEQTLRFQ